MAMRFALMLPVLAFVPWASLLKLGLRDDQYTHIVLVPFITLALIYADRRRIFSQVRYSRSAIIPLVLATLLYYERSNAGLFMHADDKLSLITILGLGVFLAHFVFCFGARVIPRAQFPLLFLLLLIPVPKPMMGVVIRFLQEGSAVFSAILFRLIHLPALRQDLMFELPGFDIEIAKQCSGVRSSIALCITSLVAGHLLLRALWRKLSLVVLTVPLVIFKNAVRIVTISSLGVYVSPSFLHGRLHEYSGIPFSVLELAIVTPLLFRWHRLEIGDENKGMLHLRDEQRWKLRTFHGCVEKPSMRSTDETS